MTYIKRLSINGFKSFASKTDIVFDKGINTIVGPNGSGKSARWDTRILLTSGEIKPIGEIVEESLKKASIINNLNDGELTFENPLNIRVLGLDQKSMKVKECNVKAFIKREGEPNLYTIKTRTGKNVTTTSCHPVLVYRDGEIKSEIVQNLRENELIATPNNLNLPEKIIPLNIDGLNVSDDNLLEVSRLLGYLVGDGSIIKNKRVDFINTDLEIINDYEKILNKLNLKIKRSNRKFSKAKTIYFNSRKISNGLVKFFKNNYKKEGKHVPKEIIFSKKEILANFLGALFDCDASVRKDNPAFEYVTMSERLANEVILSLLRFGIVARKTKKKKYASNTTLKLKKFYYHITIEGREKISRLRQNIPLKCNHKRDLLKKWSTDNAAPNTNNDLLPREINYKIKELVKLLGIKYKPLKKQYPLLASYIEDRCCPTRQGVQRIMNVFNQKLGSIIEDHRTLGMNVQILTSAMDNLNISSRDASQQLGLHGTTIRNYWANNSFNPRPENLEKFYYFIKGVLAERIPRIKEIITLLASLSTSDIFWDRINSIDKVEGEDYVYDLEIEETHNFIGNEVFVHNSNISDALCFVLGRLSIKSMRAAKAKNLLFMGSKYIKPVKEASVELILDNSGRTFNLPASEVSLKRIVKRNGQGVYKINNETKTRGEVIETLAHAGIDPYGFNIILQGNIQSLIKMHPEERRKIIEEVAGISIYELRKEKSLKELEKTDARLKEISTVLRERTAYLRNLENERAQALRFKELENTIKRCKASILTRKIEEKTKELSAIKKSISANLEKKDKSKSKILEIENRINSFNREIEKINKHIQQSTGLEQESLHEIITNLRAESEGLRVRKENYENRKEEIELRIEQIQASLPELEKEIKELGEESPKIAKKQESLKIKKDELARLEEQKKQVYALRTEITNVKDRLKEKENRLTITETESDSLLKQIEEYSSDFNHDNPKTCLDEIERLKASLSLTKEGLSDLSKKELEGMEKISSAKTQVALAEKIKSQIAEIDVCPLCQNKMTPAHEKHVISDSDKKIQEAEKSIGEYREKLGGISAQKEKSLKQIEDNEKALIGLERELSGHNLITEKKQYLKKLVEESKLLKKEIKDLEAKRESLEKKSVDFSRIEEEYGKKLSEIEEISSRTEKDLDTTLLYKQRELEKSQDIIKRSKKDLEDVESEILEIDESMQRKLSLLEKKEDEERELNERFKMLFKKRDSIQENIQKENYDHSTCQSELHQIEDQINYLKVGNARVDAEREAHEMELGDYSGFEPIKASIPALEEKLQKSQVTIQTIGSINLRALEVYEDIKGEYDKVREKVETLEKEKSDILSIIEEIDKKKKRTFMKTFNGINELFSRNFSQLYSKGTAFLEVENKESLFNGGINIAIKLAKGKYFDVTSLSGGEQTLIALALLFAIQEYKPHHFYVFDEIDAALDKRNSERLSALLKKYIKAGQYVIVTHNDAIITDSNHLYGVSMHDGVSKILSLKLD